MYSKIPLMNLAANFVPNGSKILSADDNPRKIGMRADDNKLVIVVEYTYKSNPYTMVLENLDGEWKIVDIYDTIGESIERDQNLKNNIDKRNSSRQAVAPSIKFDGAYLWDEEIGDVTGNKLLDKVYITAINPRDETEFADDIKLIIQDGDTAAKTEIKIPANSGYRPNLELRDLTGNGVEDILVSIFGTGSGEDVYFYAYSFENQEVKTLFDYDDFNTKNKFDVDYMDGYKVKVISKLANKEYIIDISNKCPSYLNQLYNSNGTLKASLKGEVSVLNAAYPIDISNNNTYVLMCYNRVIGINLLDVLGQIQTYLKWDGLRFIPISQYLLNSGEEIGVPKNCAG